MTYTPYVWQDGSTGGTPISADRLNALEQGLAAASLTPNIALVAGGNYTVSVYDGSVIYTALNNAVTVTVGAPSGYQFGTLIIANHTANTSPINVTSTSQINGTATKSFSGAWATMILVPMGTTWHAFLGTAIA